MNTGTGGAYTDSTGRRLEDYKHPSVAVDTAVVTVLPGGDSLSVLLVWREAEPRDGTVSGWVLPGTFVREGERAIDAVRRSLREKGGIESTSPGQLHLFDTPGRDTRGWVWSAAHLDVVPASRLAGLDPDKARLVSVSGPLAAEERPEEDCERVRAHFSGLPFEHGEIIAKAVQRVRDEYGKVPDPFHLLPEPFTILQLRLLHQAVAGAELQRDTFRRTMLPHLREATQDKAVGARGRPASLFRHQASS